MNNDMDKWSEIPNELVEMVVDRLPLIDHIRFGAVCSSWYQVTEENHHRFDFRDQLPFMMLPEKELSSKGWVLTVDESGDVHLLNPFTSTKIQLPSLDKFPDNQNQFCDDEPRNYRYIFKTVLSANPISTQDYIVVTIVTYMAKLSYYKPGDEKWTTINNEWFKYEDAIYFKDKFYAITNSNAVVTCDFASSDFPKFSVITHPHINSAEKRYLVESSARLLKVLRYLELNEDEDENVDWYRTEMFEVFELDEEAGRWIKIESLGDQMLFLGYGNSFSVSGYDFPQCEGNCIYFTDDFDEVPRCGLDNGVFNMEDKSLKPFYPCSSSWITKPVWVLPYLSK
ncbi:F-box protein SKIP23-like [Tasmannia lanceolata]|uniref:F-box protein SKIP23-like n=1 Tax=Tasmannia lanceolata TaxID=3420 RepID=UPI004064ABD7